MANKHQKHAHLERPHSGNFGRNEWAIIGAPCGEIKKLAFDLIRQLSNDFKIAYVDADHPKGETVAISNDPINFGANMVYTDKITHHRIDTKESMDKFQAFSTFQEQDLIFINGNHFVGQQQIVIIDPKKEVSLSKKLDRLTNVQMILLTDEGTDVYPFLAKHLRGIPTMILPISETEIIARYIRQKTLDEKPPIYGLVLAGGNSIRMGEDKGAIIYHEKPQREHAAELLTPYCQEVLISCREDQITSIESNFNLLPDTFLGLGPYGGILSAFQRHPNVAWMVVACDLPLLNQETLNTLFENRDQSKTATCFESNRNEFPEPLITIWEPRSYSTLLQFLAQGYSCPRKVLINSDVKLLPTPEEDLLRNINTPEERDSLDIKGIRKK